ncbi:MAG: M1 family metallopeptidase [Chitinophagaceae bacterium]|nr:M1 family metallopeptidase [Chitinophagaceae bacterium]
MKQWFCFFIAAFIFTNTEAQDIRNNPNSNHGNKFEQLGTILPSPNEYRTASGAPGPKYWQQRADYTIACELDEENLRLSGSETVTYYNNSPDILSYLWFQLDENEHNNLRNANYQTGGSLPPQVGDAQINSLEQQKTDNGYGVNIRKLTDAAGKALPYTINKTMMRVDLPAPLKPGQKYILKINWDYKISDRMAQGGRGGFEFFPGDGNYLFTMSQWYPRLCVYSDYRGWQNHQFTGRGEFALTFGNFNVQLTVPADHVVGSTGECQNYPQTLSPTQMSRWQKAQSAKAPLEIVTLAEAKSAEQKKSSQKKTWIFKADNVRDFAWTSSRKFVWDAMPVYIEGKKIMCMSFYGKEAYGLYSRYSTKAVAHTLRSYSRFSIPYPYPVAQSVEAANGMEYPMICFNYGRTEPDGTYSEATKYGMIGVVIHEVGHNFFPMIVNSDERQWTWMDEGLNTFLEYLTEELWDNKFPTRRGPAFAIVDYMKLPKDQLEPIMTNSENIIGLGPNAYAKPATALNILRETILGRELFDFAFKEYARRWAFKHPTPADFFRTIEDATAEDLDWFWRGWFYSIDACDMAIDSVKYFIADPDAEIREGLTETTIRALAPAPILPKFDDISKIRNREDKNIVFETDKDSTLRDFYWKYARGLVAVDRKPVNYTAPAYLEPLSAETRRRIADKHFYEVSFSNKGGLVMPLIIEWTYADGTKETDRIPAQVWRYNENNLTKVFMKDKKAVAIRLDPMRETADIDESNNSWGKIDEPSRFTLYKMKQQSRGQSTGLNPMQAEEK